jgi:hypothetical protein
MAPPIQKPKIIAIVGAAGGGVVALRALEILALLLELGDVGSGGERHGPSAPEDDRADRVVLHQPLGDARELDPHGVGDCVAGPRAIEDHGGDGAGVLNDNV